jgi:hypothetical protein
MPAAPSQETARREVSMTRILMAGCALLALAGSPFAAEMMMKTELSGAQEVPPVESAATGTADITYDDASKTLTWTVEYSGLTGPATAAHFHGPAPEGENAGVAIPIDDLESPMEGSATLTDEQAQQLTDGLLYVNIHTEANPGGEIRGQVKAGM